MDTKFSRLSISRLALAEARAADAEARTEQAKTRIETAETRAEQAETRIESAKTRAEQAEIRAEEAEAHLEQARNLVGILMEMLSDSLTGKRPEAAMPGASAPKASHTDDADLRALDRLTERQREVLELIARGENTKEIADTLQISSKTVEYHRVKMMSTLNIHDVPGLVRFAIRVSLISMDD